MPPFNAPTWKKLIKGCTRDAKFERPATETQLAAVEQALSIRLPDELREFLLEADGLTADYGSGVIWSAADIQKRNQEFRTLAGFRDLYMPFDHLLFSGTTAEGTNSHSPSMPMGRFTSTMCFAGTMRLIRAPGLPATWNSSLRSA
jgi:cell wall assembly regulator SMI1